MPSTSNCPAALLSLLATLTLFAAALAQTGQPIPRIEGESFAGHQIVLPDAVSGKVAVLVFGFTKASGKQTGAWAKKISADFGQRAGFELYQLPVLEDVPVFFRGVVISGIKRGVPESDRDHFIPVLHREAELKKAVNYREPGDAYLVLLDRTGKVAQQFHASFSDRNYFHLHEEIDSLLQ